MVSAGKGGRMCTNLEDGFQGLHEAGDAADVFDGAKLHLLDLGLGGFCVANVVQVVAFVFGVCRGVPARVGPVHVHGIYGIAMAISIAISLAVGVCPGDEAIVLKVLSLVPRATKIIEQVLGNSRHGDALSRK